MLSLSAIVLVGFVGLIVISVLYRHVVSTNMVHIVQSRRETLPYGTGQSAGNVYYKWPSWVPYFGVTVIALPVSNFDLPLHGYDAYDKDRVPFMVDVVAFFRINNTAEAAQRVSSIDELKDQLLKIVQGAVRKVLASAPIDTIMLERAQFGKQFTDEVQEQLKEWGTEPVKAMELMDIRDGHDSKVISNIMAKKISHIAMESRVEVANNTKTAETAEIDAKRAVEVQRQEAEQLVGQRTAEKEKAVGIAKELARQEVLAQEKETTTRDMAEGILEAQQKEATGIKAIGVAKAEAEKAMQLAPVAAQIELAKQIGENPGYQKYLAMIEAIKAYLEVGGKQAEALQKADVKVIANAGTPTEGMRNVMDLFTSRGGTELAAMAEAIAQTPIGKAALASLGVEENIKPNGSTTDSHVK